MSVKRYMIFCAAPVLLGAACVSPAEIRNVYERASGQATLIGYLRSGAELTLYESLDDAVNHRPRKCMNGIVQNMRGENAILYDKKLVEIKGMVSDYALPDDDIEAIHVWIKNTCHSSKIFIAKEIRVITDDME